MDVEKILLSFGEAFNLIEISWINTSTPQSINKICFDFELKLFPAVHRSADRYTILKPIFSKKADLSSGVYAEFKKIFLDRSISSG